MADEMVVAQTGEEAALLDPLVAPTAIIHQVTTAVVVVVVVVAAATLLTMGVEMVATKTVATGMTPGDPDIATRTAHMEKHHIAVGHPFAAGITSWMCATKYMYLI